MRFNKTERKCQKVVTTVECFQKYEMLREIVLLLLNLIEAVTVYN